MEKSTSVKSLTLAGFVILLTSFIAFKSGAFDKYLTSEDESLAIDTPEVKRSPSMLSTSKSSTVIEQKVEFPSIELVDIDSFLDRERKLQMKDSLKADSAKARKIEKESPEMMSGSKIAIMIDQKLQFQLDSVIKRADSLKQATGK